MAVLLEGGAWGDEGRRLGHGRTGGRTWVVMMKMTRATSLKINDIRKSVISPSL